MESAQTYSIAFIVHSSLDNFQLVFKLFDSIPEEARDVFTTRQLFTTNQDFSSIKYTRASFLFSLFFRDFDIVCPVLTKDCLKDLKYTEAVKIAHSHNKKIFLLYDINHQFPKLDQQPQELKNIHLFDTKAISLISGYYDRTWQQLASKVQQNSDEEVS